MPKENLKESLSGNKLDLSVSSMSVVPVKELVSEIEKTGRKLTLRYDYRYKKQRLRKIKFDSQQ